MKITHDLVDRLQDILYDAWSRVKSGSVPECVGHARLPSNLHPGDNTREEWVWTLFMNNHDILIITRDDLVDSFTDMVNFGSAVKDSVCLVNPAQREEFLLVPFSLTERVLTLGVLA